MGMRPFAHRKPFGARRTMLIPRCMTLQPILPEVLPPVPSCLCFLRALELIPPSTNPPAYSQRWPLSTLAGATVWPSLLPRTFPSIVCQHCFDSSSSRGLFRGAHSSIGQVTFNPVARPFPASFLVSVYTQTRPLPLRCADLSLSKSIPREDQTRKAGNGFHSCFGTRGYCSATLDEFKSPLGASPT